MCPLPTLALPRLLTAYSLGRKQINKFTPINLTSLHVCPLRWAPDSLCFLNVSGLVQATGRGCGISFLLAGLLLFHPHYSGVMLVSSLHGSLTSGGQLMFLLPANFSLPIAGDLPDQDSSCWSSCFCALPNISGALSFLSGHQLSPWCLVWFFYKVGSL